jgi:hypothetical protein
MNPNKSDFSFGYMASSFSFKTDVCPASQALCMEKPMFSLGFLAI